MYDMGYKQILICSSHINMLQNDPAFWSPFCLLFSLWLHFLYHFLHYFRPINCFSLCSFCIRFLFKYVYCTSLLNFILFVFESSLTSNTTVNFDFYLWLGFQPHLTWCHLQYFSVLSSSICTSWIKIVHGSRLKINCWGCPLKLFSPLMRNHW